MTTVKDQIEQKHNIQIKDAWYNNAGTITIATFDGKLGNGDDAIMLFAKFEVCYLVDTDLKYFQIPTTGFVKTEPPKSNWRLTNANRL